MNISNTNNIKVETLQFRLIDLYGNTDSIEKDIDLYPGDTDIDFNVLKQGTQSNVKIIPIIEGENEEIICQESAIEKENIKYC